MFVTAYSSIAPLASQIAMSVGLRAKHCILMILSLPLAWQYIVAVLLGIVAYDQCKYQG